MGQRGVEGALPASMTETAVAVPCPHCGHLDEGNFCSQCGSHLRPQLSALAVSQELAGVRFVRPLKIWRTLRDSIVRPHRLLAQWQSGARGEIVSPVKLIGWITALHMLSAQVMILIYGAKAPERTDEEVATSIITNLHWLEAPFGRSVLSDPKLLATFNQALGYLMSMVLALWPTLFVIAGFLAMAPWRLINRKTALLAASVETIFIMFSGSVIYLGLAIATSGNDSAHNGFFVAAWLLSVIAHSIHFLRQEGLRTRRIIGISLLSVVYMMLLLMLMVAIIVLAALGWVALRH